MTTIPPPAPRHGINELLTLVDRLRRIAFDRSLNDNDIARRVRDEFKAYDERGLS